MYDLMTITYRARAPHKQDYRRVLVTIRPYDFLNMQINTGLVNLRSYIMLKATIFFQIEMPERFECWEDIGETPRFGVASYEGDHYWKIEFLWKEP